MFLQRHSNLNLSIKGEYFSKVLYCDSLHAINSGVIKIRMSVESHFLKTVGANSACVFVKMVVSSIFALEKRNPLFQSEN